MSCADGEATRSSAVPDGGVWAINATAKNTAGKARHRFTRVIVISRFERYGLPCHSVYHEICDGNPTLWMSDGWVAQIMFTQIVRARKCDRVPHASVWMRAGSDFSASVRTVTQFVHNST